MNTIGRRRGVSVESSAVFHRVHIFQLNSTRISARAWSQRSAWPLFCCAVTCTNISSNRHTRSEHGWPRGPVRRLTKHRDLLHDLLHRDLLRGCGLADLRCCNETRLKRRKMWTKGGMNRKRREEEEDRGKPLKEVFCVIQFVYCWWFIRILLA